MIKKYLIKSLMLVVLLIILSVTSVAFLGFTQQGSILLGKIATSSVSGLSIENISGALFDKITITNLNFKQQEQQLKFKKATLKLDWQALFQAKLKLDKLRLEKLTILNLKDKITIDSLQSKLVVNRKQIKIIDTSINNTKLFLAATSKKQATTKKLQLPQIKLPIEIDLAALNINNLQIFTENQQKAVFLLNSLHLRANFIESKLAIKDLKIQALDLKAQAQGSLDLVDNYPLDIKIKASYQTIEDLELKLTGDLADFKAQIDLDNKEQLNAVVQANVLDAKLPFSIVLNKANLRYRYKNDLFSILNSSANIAGNLQEYKIKLQTDITKNSKKLAKLNIKARGNLQQLDNYNLDILMDNNGSLNLSGNISWQEKLHLAASLLLKNFYLEQLGEINLSNINGAMSISSTIESLTAWDVNLSKLNIRGKYAKQKLLAQGQLKIAQNKKALMINAAKLQFLHGKNKLVLRGDVQPKLNLSLVLNIENLGQSIPNLDGSVFGDIKLVGSLAKPKFKIALQLKDISDIEKNYQLKTVNINGFLNLIKWTDTFEASSDLKIKAKQLNLNQQEFSQVNLDIKGNNKLHNLDFNFIGVPLTGNFKIKGSLEEKKWQGELLNTWIKTPLEKWYLSSNTKITYSYLKQRLQVSKHCWDAEQGQLCFIEDIALQPNEPGFFKLKIKNVDLNNLQLMQQPFALLAKVNGSIYGSWDKNANLSLMAELAMSAGKFIKTTKNKLELVWQKVALNLSLKARKLIIDYIVEITSQQKISGKLNLNNYKNKNSTILANLNIDQLNLAPLTPLLDPKGSVLGKLNGELVLKGNLKQPLIYGQMNLDNLQILGSTTPIEVISGAVNFEGLGQKIKLNSKIKTPEGALVINSNFNWKNLAKWNALINVKGNNLKVIPQENLAIELSPDLNLQLSDKDSYIKGRIDIPWARILVKNVPQGAVSVSDDVILLDENLQPIAKPKLLKTNLHTNVKIGFGNDVLFKAFGLRTLLTGILEVSQVNQLPHVVGKIKLNEGTYRAFGQDLLIRTGIIDFTGAVDKPFVQLEAIRNPDSIEDDVEAGVRVTGIASNAKINIFSNPSMPQANNLSYLLRGRDLGNDGSSGVMSSALIGLGLYQTSDMIGAIGTALGMQDLAVDTEGAGDSSQIAVSGYLTPNLQLKYGVGIFDSIGKFTLKYRMMKNLYLQAVSGLDNAVDVLYQFSFD